MLSAALKQSAAAPISGSPPPVGATLTIAAHRTHGQAPHQQHHMESPEVEDIILLYGGGYIGANHHVGTGLPALEQIQHKVSTSTGSLGACSSFFGSKHCTTSCAVLEPCNSTDSFQQLPTYHPIITSNRCRWEAQHQHCTPAVTDTPHAVLSDWASTPRDIASPQSDVARHMRQPSLDAADAACMAPHELLATTNSLEAIFSGSNADDDSFGPSSLRPRGSAQLRLRDGVLRATNFLEGFTEHTSSAFAGPHLQAL